MRFSVASGTDNSLLQTIANQTLNVNQYLRPYGIVGIALQLPQYQGTGIAPHVAVERWTYTVPANKIARVDMISLSQTRVNASTTIGNSSLTLNIAPGGINSVRLLKNMMRTQAIGDTRRIDISPKIILSATDRIYGYTEDTSLGGGVSYLASVVISEIDA